MPDPIPAAHAASPQKADRHRPLRPYLLGLTVVTGIVDAISYLTLGQVFVANMTGNVVFLGFAVAGRQSFSIPASLTAIAAFLVGALAGGRLGTVIGQHRGRHLAMASYIEIVLVAVALAVSVFAHDLDTEAGRYVLIVLLALAMGLQNATARRLGVPDLTTTVLTLTLTAFAADSTLVGGTGSHARLRLTATALMFLGAAIGALLITRLGVSAALAAGVALLAVIGSSATRLWTSSEEWTVGA